VKWWGMRNRHQQQRWLIVLCGGQQLSGWHCMLTGGSSRCFTNDTPALASVQPLFTRHSPLVGSTFKSGAVACTLTTAAPERASSECSTQVHAISLETRC
jgi:hypothetical protein